MKCEGCHWWHRLHEMDFFGSNTLDDSWGRCKRRSPSPVSDAAATFAAFGHDGEGNDKALPVGVNIPLHLFIAHWPITSDCDGCGDWQAFRPLET